MLIVTNGLVQTPEGLHPHPALTPLQRDLRRYSRHWFAAAAHTPLSLVAWLTGRPAAELLAARSALPDETRQCWVASPFNAQLMRDHLQVMPEGMFPWAADDAEAVVGVLNPLLSEEGMALQAVGSALLLTCRESLDAQPLPFADVAGKLLPNQHPPGPDGGRLMRLLAEIQMVLYRNPLETRRQRGEPDVRGLWLWGRCAVPCAAAPQLPPIATRNPFLASIADGRDARFTITDAEQLDALRQPSEPLPHEMLLLGDGHALWLKRSLTAPLTVWLRPVSGAGLEPRGVKPESELLQRIGPWQ